VQRPDVFAELLELIANDERVRERLARNGSLFLGYHPEMETVHRENAERLRAIIDEVGWPGRTMVGDAGADAAWRVAQHAIGEPAFMREALELVHAAVERGEAPAAHAAYLEDRVRSLEGRPQLYGTQYDWDESGQLGPYPEIEDRASVDARRAALGLGPITENTARMRAGAAANNERPLADLAARRREMGAWARKAGWRAD
jgi:hypothetical protein